MDLDTALAGPALTREEALSSGFLYVFMLSVTLFNPDRERERERKGIEMASCPPHEQ